MYHFFYDETEHSRAITLNTVASDNYVDEFSISIIGWNADDESKIIRDYLQFEKSYESRKKGDELKSDTFGRRDFEKGFASLNRNKIGFYADLIDTYSNSIITYFSVSSKLEYILIQLLANYIESPMINAKALVYIIVKAINVYRPRKVIDAIYDDKNSFVKELKIFLKKRIELNKSNFQLKSKENEAFGQIVVYLDNVEEIKDKNWPYSPAFIGFAKYLKEMKIDEYSIVVDKEGWDDFDKTMNAAQNVGLKNVSDEKSTNSVGIRMADMLIGLISRMMKSLKKSLYNSYPENNIEKTELKAEWFVLDEKQYNLYLKLHNIVCENNNYWHKTYAGIYADSFIAFVSLLQYVGSYGDYYKYLQYDEKQHSEKYNSFLLTKINEYLVKL